MDPNQLEAVTRLITMLSNGGADIVSSYTHYMFWSALGWMSLGIFLIYTGVKVFLVKETGQLKWELEEIQPIITAVFIIIGIFFVLFNLPQLLSPSGMAYHQIFKDVL